MISTKKIICMFSMAERELAKEKKKGRKKEGS